MPMHASPLSRVQAFWHPQGTDPFPYTLSESALSQPEALALFLQQPLLALEQGREVRRAGPGQLLPRAQAGAAPVRAWVPPLRLSALGNPAFRETYGVRFALMTGAMANGIASVDLVEAAARAGFLGSFGAAGLSLERVRAALSALQQRLGAVPFAVNLIHSPDEPAHEAAVASLLLEHGVKVVEASAYLDLTLPLVRYRTAGIFQTTSGEIVTPNRVIAKVSRVEVASRFLAPPPASMLARLIEEGHLTPSQARMAARIPLCDDLTAEADSGGHTDNRPLVVLLPLLQALVEEQQQKHGFSQRIRVGAAGGMGTPAALHAAFSLGADYVVTGSINQCTLEAGTSDPVRQLLARAASTDVSMAPAADMFELGVTVQVLSRGTLFAVRARKLYELYKTSDSVESLSAAERQSLEKQYFKQSLTQAWQGVEHYFAERDPEQLERAAREPRHKLALLFRSYLGQASRWANAGVPERGLDYQIWCGPAMGACNEWLQGSPLEPWQARDVASLNLNLLLGAAWLTRLAQLRLQGASVPERVQRLPVLMGGALEQVVQSLEAPAELETTALEQAGEETAPRQAGTAPELGAEPIAIVGMGCLFPGAQDVESWWRLLRTGQDTVTEIPTTHWRVDDYFDANPKAPDMTYARRGAFLDPYAYDPTAFGIPPNILEATDTSQLLGLTVAKMALEDAGYSEEGDWDRSRTSVLMGVTGTQELVISLGARLGHPHWRRALQESGVPEAQAEEVVERIRRAYVGWQENSFPGLLGNVVAGRIANRLNLGGTNTVVDAACASSLAAMHLACLELQARRSDLVLTGGVDTLNDIFMYMCFSKTPALSPTGDARPFSDRADGTLLGEGIGMVVLKRLSDAQRDGDRIYAVIKSIGTSSDGRAKSIYAPLPQGQARALRNAYQQAGVSPLSVELVEAHGTGTKAGDVGEFEGLQTVYREASQVGRWCALGSVKSQIGHTKSTAGAAGLMKAALALYHKVLPPTIKVDAPNPALSIEKSPFYLSTQTRPWLKRLSTPRRAGVSAFGFGGSNFHAVLEEAQPNREQVAWDGSVELLPLSDQHWDGLLQQLEALEKSGSEGMSRLARQARAHFQPQAPVRLVMVLTRGEALSSRLARAKALVQEAQQPGATRGLSHPEGTYVGQGQPEGGLAVLFPGQGAQYVGMLRELTCLFPEMQEEVEAVPGLADVLYPMPTFDVAEQKAQERLLTRTDWTQPALGALEVGLSRLLQRFELRPSAFAGHSFGELSALYAAGVLSAEGLRLAARTRGRLMAGAGSDRGSMLAVMAPLAEVEGWLAQSGLPLVLANRNTPQQGVISGGREALAQAEQQLRERGMSVKRLEVAAAFHSPLVAEAEQGLRVCLEALPVSAPRVPVMANSTAQPYPAEPDLIRQQLASQLARPVLFWESIEQLYQLGLRTFVELGPRQVLSGMVRQTLGRRSHVSMALDASSGRKSGIQELAQLLAQLAALGYALDLRPWQDNRWINRGQGPLISKPSKLKVVLTGANHREPDKSPLPKRPPGEPLPVAAEPAGPPAQVSARQNLEQRQAEKPRMPQISPVELEEARPILLTQLKKEQSMNETTPAPYLGAGMATTPPPTPVTPRADVLLEALRNSQEQLRALQSLQHQTASVHQRFLEGIEVAQRGFLTLLEGQQRMVEQVLTGAIPAGALASGGLLTSLPPLLPPVSPLATAVMPTSTPTFAHAPVHAPVYAPAYAHAPVQAPVVQAPVTQAPVVQAPVAQAPVAQAPVMPAQARNGISNGAHSAPVGRSSVHPAVTTPAVTTPAVTTPAVTTPAATAQTSPAPVSAPKSNPASAELVSKSAAPEAVGTSAAGPDIKSTLLAVVSELTGYPTDMLELGMEMESDLGIDSIKRVEILSVLSSRLPGSKKVEPEQLSGIRTLGQVLEFMQKGSGSLGKSEARGDDGKAVAKPETELLPLEQRWTPAQQTGLERFVVQPRRLGPLPVTVVSQQARRTPVWMVYSEEEPELAERLEAHLSAEGLPVLPVLRGETLPEVPTRLGGLIFLPSALQAEQTRSWSARQEQEALRDFQLLQACAAALRSAREADEAPAFVMALLSWDGTFGHTPSFWQDRSVSPLPLAWGGLVKSVRHEWPDVQVRLVDVAVELEAETQASCVLDALTPARPVEVGYNENGCFTLELIPQAFVKQEEEDESLPEGALVLVTGGARGVTSACVEALAEHRRLQLVLLGRSPLPGPEPAWLSEASDESAIKKALLKHAFDGQKPTPKQVGEQCMQVLAAREVRQTLSRLEKRSAGVTYLALDIRDQQALSQALAPLTAQHGPVQAVIHGAGVLHDRRIEDKTPAQFAQVLETKLTGLRSLLEVLEPSALKSLVLFTSVSGRFGRRGQLDYAMANQGLDGVAQALAQRLPSCRVVALAWGPWEGGMVTPGLKREFEKEGVGLIPLQAGARQCVRELLASPGGAAQVVLGMGLAGMLEPWPTETPETLSLHAQQPFLADHRLGGNPVLPFAMSASLLTQGGAERWPGLSGVSLEQVQLLKGLVLEPAQRGASVQVVLEPVQVEDSSFVQAGKLLLAEGRPLVRGHVRLELPAEGEGVSLRLPVDRLLAQQAQRDFAQAGGDMLRADWYTSRQLFHGATQQTVEAVRWVDPQHGQAMLKSAPEPMAWGLPFERWTLDPLLLDGLFQLLILWGWKTQGRPCLPAALGAVRWQRGEPLPSRCWCDFTIESVEGDTVVASARYLNALGRCVLLVEGARATLSAALKERFLA